MKRLVVFLFLVLLGFVSASVTITNHLVEDEYFPLDKIKGSVVLVVEGVDYNEVIVLSDDSEIVLGDFLVSSGMSLLCEPTDCLMGYSSSSPTISKTTAIVPSDDEYIGFVLTGSDIDLKSIDFKISSDFGKGSELPLAIEFFEDEQWKFEEFSNDLLSKNWGCFDPSSKTVGSLISSSFYCEMISLGDSGKLEVGADVVLTGTGELDMEIYSAAGFARGGCSFNPNTEEGCTITPEAGEIISGGDYLVCVGADSVTNYRIYEDTVGVNCGFPLYAGSASIIKDYSIFAQGVKYEAAGGVLDLTLSDDHVDSANMYIAQKYGGDCSVGCVLPLKISGVSQNFKIYDVNIIYEEAFETKDNKLVHELEESPAKLYFLDTVDLGLLDIVVSRVGEYFATLLGEDLFRVNATFFVVPVISLVSPLNPSVGVSTEFYADVYFEGNASLSYEWDFGDNESAKTSVPNAAHTYGGLNNYTLSLRVIPNGNLTLSSVGNFTVEPISPEAAVVAGLLSKKNSLAKVRTNIEEFSNWYVGDLLELLEIVDFEGELARLEKAKNDSSNVQDLVDIRSDIDALDVPIDIWADIFESSLLDSDAEDIDIDPVVAISGENVSGTNKDYVYPILSWQEENVDVSVQLENVFGLYSGEMVVNILNAYSFDITSRGKGESYFVIDVPLDELHFNKDVGAREAGSSTVIVLKEGEKEIVEFYYVGVGSASFFVSPKLSSFVIEADIAGDCNFNKVCEKDLGENSDNCRNDCKPLGKAVWFFIIGLIVFLVVYTGLQVWYKRHYEAYLFKDRAQMYNLLMYVTNARTRGMKDSRIGAELRSKGWSSERVNYVIRKSVGKSIGMIEIIPIEFISSLIRKRKSKKAVVATTFVPQQKRANINKSRVRV